MNKGLYIVLFLIVKFSFGQEFTDLKGDYLDQPLPGDKLYYPVKKGKRKYVLLFSKFDRYGKIGS